MKTNIDKLKERHQKMLEFQSEIYPFTPTIRELQEIWNLSTSSAAFDVIKKLIEMDCIKSRTKGKHTQYYAI